MLPLLAVALIVVGYATGPLVISHSLPDVPGVAASADRAHGHGRGLRAVRRPAARRARPTRRRRPCSSLVALGAVCTAAALALFFALIREAGPQRALVITFVNPAVAVLLGVLLLGEPFTLGHRARAAAGAGRLRARHPAQSRRLRSRRPTPMVEAPLP